MATKAMQTPDDAQITHWLNDLNNDDEAIRHSAIRHLAAAKAAVAAQPMLHLLQHHPDLLTRWEVIKALPAVVTEADIASAVASARDRTAHTSESIDKRMWLEMGMLGIEHPLTRDLLEYSSSLLVKDLAALRGSYEGDLLAELIDLVVHPRALLRIAYVLEDWENDTAFPYLLKIAQRVDALHNFDLWQSVAFTLCSPNPDDTNIPLRQRAVAFYEPILYADPTTVTTPDLAMAIGVLGLLDEDSPSPPQYAARIAELLSHDHDAVRFTAAYIFNLVYYPPAVPALIAALRVQDLHSQDEETRYVPAWVVKALEDQKDPAAIPALKTALETVRQWIANGDLSPEELMPANGFVISLVEALANLSSFDAQERERLLRMLYDPDVDTPAATAIIEALGKARYAPAVDRLMQMAAPDFRRHFERVYYAKLLETIAVALGEIGDLRARDTLTMLLEYPYDRVKSYAQESLDKLNAADHT
jgi:HEAT repeat protein